MERFLVCCRIPLNKFIILEILSGCFCCKNYLHCNMSLYKIVNNFLFIFFLSKTDNKVEIEIEILHINSVFYKEDLRYYYY